MNEKKDLDNMILFLSILMIIYGSCVILRWIFYIASGLIRYFTFPYSTDIMRKIALFLSQIIAKFGYYICCGILGRRTVNHKVKPKTAIIFLIVFLVLDLVMLLFYLKWTYLLECILPLMLIYNLKKVEA